jgi:HEAT repeat protein
LCQGDDDEWVRYRAVGSIGKIATAPIDVVPTLKQVVRKRDEEGFIRQAALVACYDADPNATSVLPLLVDGLRDDDGGIVAAAAATLGQFGAKAKPAVPVLIAALSTEKLRWTSFADFGFQVPVRSDVVWALASLGPTADAAVPRLTEVMTTDANEVTRMEAAAALALIAPTRTEGRRGLSVLVHIVRDDDHESRSMAVEILGTIGSQDAVGVLIEALKAEDQSEDQTFRQGVVQALGQIGPPAEAAVPALRDLLNDENQIDVHWEVVNTLGLIGPAAKSAVPDLKRYREDSLDADDVSLRQEIDEAIERILADD